MLHSKKYNEFIYHLKRVIDISKELSDEDLSIIKEELKIEVSKREIRKLLKEAI
jgi:hypothetical protein